MGGFNSTPDRTATQSSYRREIEYDDYYRTHSTRRTNVTATQSSAIKQIDFADDIDYDFDNYYWSISKPRTNVTATQSSSIKQIDFEGYYRTDSSCPINVTATQSSFRREIDYDDYYRTNSTRRTNVTATQSSAIKQIDFADDIDYDFDNYYRFISTPQTNVTATQSSSIKQIDFKGYHRTDSSCPINVTATQSLSIKQIDLNNYYKNDRTRKLISCQICRLDISRKDVFKHTVSKRHKYNKLFIAVSQNRCPNGDVDFIVLDIDRLACRYCNSRLIIDSDSDDFIVKHIQDVWHIQKKQASLNRIGFNDASVSTAGYSNKLLQPLDSFVTHDIKNRKRMKKKVPNLKKKASSLAKLEEKLKEQRVVNNVGQNTDQQYSSISGNYQKMWGIELPKCITIREGDSYICTICCIEIPKNIMNLGIHINGSEHTRKMISKSMQPKAIDVDKVLGPFRIEETVTDSKATNKIVENHISQSSAVYQDETVPFEKEFEDCISLAVNGISTCTVCSIKLTGGVKTANDHLTGKKHQKKILNLIKSKNRQLKLEYEDEKAQFEKEFEDCISLAVNGMSTCMVCGTKMLATSKTINDHLNGKKHKGKIVKLIESKKQQLKLKYRKKFIPAPVAFRNTNNIVENNRPQSSAVYQDETTQFTKEFEDCISLAVNGISTCTVCGTKMLAASKTRNEHLNGKYHKEKIVKLMESKKQQLKLEYAKKLISALVDFKDTSNISEYNIKQSSAVYQDETVPFEKEFEDCISLAVNGISTCTVCSVQLSADPETINDHLDGKKHVKKIIRLIESKKQKLKLEYVQKLVLVPVDFKDTENIIENQVYQDEIAQFEKKLEDCIRLGRNYISTCTVCGRTMLNTPKNINEHLNGEKHKERILKLIECEKQKLKLKDMNKLIPAPVGIVKKGMYKCINCNVTVPNHVNCIKAHEGSKKHVKMLLQREC